MWNFCNDRGNHLVLRAADQGRHNIVADRVHENEKRTRYHAAQAERQEHPQERPPGRAPSFLQIGVGKQARELPAAVIAADGKLTVQPLKANADAPVDCFYIYPTVSLDKSLNSDTNWGDGCAGRMALLPRPRQSGTRR